MGVGGSKRGREREEGVEKEREIGGRGGGGNERGKE